MRRLAATLLLLPILPAAVIQRRLSWVGYSVDPSRLPRRSFARLEVAFVQCPGCGDDGRLMIAGTQMAKVWSHYFAVKMLADWQHTLSLAQYTNLYRQVAEADWLQGYQMMPPLPRSEPSFAEVDKAVHNHLKSLQEQRRSG